jgi:hypothetical protein
VASIEWTYDLTRRLAWTEKFAAKLTKETLDGAAGPRTHTYLSISRLDLTFWKRLEYGVEFRLLRQKEAGDTRLGWLNEVLHPVGKHLRVGVGFNFTDFSDDEFSDNEYSMYGWFFRVQGKY